MYELRGAHNIPKMDTLVLLTDVSPIPTLNISYGSDDVTSIAQKCIYVPSKFVKYIINSRKFRPLLYA